MPGVVDHAVSATCQAASDGSAFSAARKTGYPLNVEASTRGWPSPPRLLILQAPSAVFPQFERKRNFGLLLQVSLFAKRASRSRRDDFKPEKPC